MGLTALGSALRRHRRVAVDSNVFIYQLGANPRYVEFTGLFFRWLEQPGRQAVTSTITMTEILVQPYRASDQRRVDEFYALLATFPNLEWLPPNLEIADLAARFRAEHRLRTPDAIQAATAVHSGATGLLTNDPAFRRVDAFETLALDRLVPTG